MKHTKKILKCLGISTGAENTTWSPDNISGDQCLSQVTHLDDGYVVPKRFTHFIASQEASTSDSLTYIDEPETCQIPIDVNAIIVKPNCSPEDDSDSFEADSLDTRSYSVFSELEESPDFSLTVQEIMTVSMSTRPKKLRKLKNKIRRLLACFSSPKVSSSVMINDVTTVHELNKEEDDSSVCDAVKRLRHRMAMLYP